MRGSPVQHPASNQVLLNLAEDLANRFRIRLRGLATSQLLDDLLLQSADLGQPLHLVGDPVGIAEPALGNIRHPLNKCLVNRCRGPIPSGLADLRSQGADRFDDHLHLLVGEQHSAEHFVLGEFLGFGLNHQYRIAGAGNHHVELRVLERLVAWVEHVAMVPVADPSRADRPGKGNAGEGEGGGGADHGGDVGILVLIGGHDRGHHLHLIHEPLGKQGANRAGR